MRRMAVIASLALAAAVLTACGGRTPCQGGAEGQKVYCHALDGAPTTLDPVEASNVYSNFVILNLYHTLYEYKYLARPYELKPNLAKGMPKISDDGLTYHIEIQRGVHYVDDPVFDGGAGREVTAHDVVYSIKRHFDPETISRGAWLWRGKLQGLQEWQEAGGDYSATVEGVKALDRYTVEFNLTEPYPQLVHTLAMGFSAVVPREAVERGERALDTHPVGSGPFRLESFNTSKAVLVPNPEYDGRPVNLEAEGFDPERHGGYGLQRIEGRTPPFVDRLELHFIGQNAARWSSFITGREIHHTVVPRGQVDAVLKSKQPPRLKPRYADKYHMKAGIEAGVIYTELNMDHSKIGYHEDPERERRNRALRCAIRKAFDWPQRNKSIYSNLGRTFPGIIPPTVPEFDPDASRASLRRDVAGAKELLAEHDWTPQNLPTLTYGFRSTVTNRQMFEQLRDWLGDIGYPSDKIQAETFATFGDFSRALRESELDFWNIGWNLDYPDAQNVLQLYYGPNGAPGSNSANYDNPEYNRLYERASTMQRSPERTRIYRRMNRMLLDDCVTIAGLSRMRIFLWHDNVVAYPDRGVVGGFFLKYVDTQQAAEPAE